MGTPDRPESVYLDTNCFVDWAQGTHGVREAESMLRAGRAGHVRLFTSTLTFAEARGTNASEYRLRIRTLLQEPYITLIDVTRRVGLLANDITADRPKIKGADAVHLACACFAGAEVFMTRNFRDFSPGDVYKGVLLSMPFEFGGEGIFPTSDIG
ncbi:type II toxin-antitoxin system VapC family toxin [Streptomyces sp. NPDC057245]|uniref:type II toxin-antitoxin system VapC family toxin n=1 Tax=Streptomyces TaxID=1883 RepID=UPI001C1E0D8F|nr:PIN domain-containing protein [Streptomyces sp. A108]MBU6535567.1 PIN domain-containing protein [Streptomyces sp. A108]